MPLKLLREPLLHFLLLGAALFALFDLARSADGPGPDEIVISAGQIESLAAGFARVWQRPPTREELDALVEDHLAEELLYREALAMGLEQDDTIVRRRLRQKMELLAEDIGAQREASDTDLQQHLDEHPQAFRSELRLSFAHVYLSTDRRGAGAEADARRILAQLEAGGSESEVAELGDPIALAAAFDDAGVGEISRLFGDDFAANLSVLEIGRWAGPIGSGYGLHLVRVSARTESRLPSLAQVRDVVEREWRNRQRQQTLSAFLAKLRERYTLRIEWPDHAAAPGPPE